MEFEYFLFYHLKKNNDIIWKKNGFKKLQNQYSKKKFKLPSNIEYDYNEYKKNVYKQFPFLIKYNKDKLVVRYSLIGALGNISLSVTPAFKKHIEKKYNVKHELFGSFYNTYKKFTYNCLFSDIEDKRCCGDFYDFIPTSGGYLVNPPYTENYINDVIYRMLTWLSDIKNLIFIVILPLWDKKSRDLYNLKKFDDMKSITSLLSSTFLYKHKIYPEFKFYNGVTNKYVRLKDPIHFIILKNF